MTARLVALLIVFSAILPQGTMLARDSQSGLIEVTICSSIGSRTVLLNPETGEYLDSSGALKSGAAGAPAEVPDHADSDFSPCPFAVAGDISNHAPPVSCETADRYAVIQFGATAPPARSLVGAPFPPRGPPAHA